MDTRFVKLTGFADHASTVPTEVFVNPTHIALFKSVKLGQARTRIFFATDGTLEVAETPSDVLVALRWCGLHLTTDSEIDSESSLVDSEVCRP
jgi:hypothetical protein